jgi:hypothetical protein
LVVQTKGNDDLALYPERYIFHYNTYMTSRSFYRITTSSSSRFKFLHGSTLVDFGFTNFDDF